MAPEQVPKVIIDEILLMDNEDKSFRPHIRRKVFQFGNLEHVRWEHHKPVDESRVLHPNTLVIVKSRFEIPGFEALEPDSIEGVKELEMQNNHAWKKAFQITTNIPSDQKIIYQVVLPINHYCHKELVKSNGGDNIKDTKAHIVTRRIDYKNIQQNITWVRFIGGDSYFLVYFFGEDINILDQTLHNRKDLKFSEQGPFYTSTSHYYFERAKNSEAAGTAHFIKKHLEQKPQG